MSEDKNIKDQAFLLNNMMDQINEDSEIEDNPSDNNTETERIDLLNLPPRSTVHEAKKTKVKWKIRFPLIRLLFILFLLIVVLILTFNNFWGKEFLNTSVLFDPINPAGEKVRVVASDKDKETKMDEEENADSNGEKAPNEQNKAINDEEIENKQEVETEETNKDNKDAEKIFYYKVTSTDTLSSLAIKFYGNKQGEEIIAEANQLSDSVLETGRVIIIPNSPKVKN